MNVWSNTEEEVIDNTNVTYQTTLSAQVLNEYNSSMPNIQVLFNLLTDGVGSLDNALNSTSETGEPATVIYTIEPSTLEGITSDNVQVSFNVSEIGIDEALLDNGMIKIENMISDELKNMCKVFLNGKWIGIHRDPEFLYKIMRLLKLNSIIHLYTSIYWNIHINEIYIFTK